MRVERLDLPVSGVRAMAWVGGHLVDAADGWRTLFPTAGEARFGRYGDHFDAVAAAPRGDVFALVATAGTKGLLLRDDGSIIREVDRSDYHADAYRFPIALFTSPDGRTALVHCPRAYNELVIEVALTGEAIIRAGQRKPADIFHSRLAVSDDGSLLLSAGWLWHPWGSLHVYDLSRAVRGEASGLDGVGDVFDLRGLIQAEVAGACFVGRDVVVSTSDEPNDPEDPDDLGPLMLARWSTAEQRFLWRHTMAESPGDLTVWRGHVLSLNQHLRLYDGSTGRLLAEWPDLVTGESTTSITWADTFRGPSRIAIDRASGRLAYTDGERVVILDPA